MTVSQPNDGQNAEEPTVSEDVGQRLTAVETAMKGLAREVRASIEKTDLALHGDGGDDNPGLIKRVDRAETALKARDWHLKALWTGFITLVTSAVVAGMSLAAKLFTGQHS
jgi:hypothetical protein